MSQPTILQHALSCHAAGLSVVPIAPDGTKRPSIRWKAYQDAPPTEDEVHRFFTDGTEGIGVVTGSGSGNLEMLEVEGRGVHLAQELGTLMHDNGMGDLWRRINAGWVEVSPSGGIHWHYRVDGPAARNTKLARRLATAEELEANPGEKIKVLIETRGQGGFTVIAPSGGRTHATGKSWTVLAGGPTTCPTITVEERDALFVIASVLDQMPAADPVPPSSRTTSTESGTRPGDDYNNRANWDDILTPRGWTKTKRFGNTAFGWTRPGKSAPEGISATTGTSGDGADRLYVFTTSTDFDAEKPYSKFSAYTLLEHGGNYSAAAKALRADGYGEEPHVEAPASDQVAPFGVVEGNLAAVRELPPPEDRPVKVLTERTLTHSDDANALALINQYGERIRFVPERGRWLSWDGARWQWCPPGGGNIREYGKRVSRSFPEDSTAAVTHKKRSLSANGIAAMLTQAATDDRVSVQLDHLDADPHALNTPAGTVDLRTGKIATADPTQLHTRMTTVTPEKIPTPLWDGFLDDTFSGHPDVGGFVQRLAGYSSTGIVTHHVLPFLHGPGGNGKSVFLDVLRALLGDYAGSAPARFLMAHQQSHETEIARLSGLRFVICSEVNQEDKFDEAKVKLLTGGDALAARFMHQDHFTFTPTHHLWLMGNHQPKVSGGGESFWRRLRMVPFTNTVPDEKKIDNLAQRLIAEEGPGILAWVIDGAIEILRDGLHAPEEVMAATSIYAEEEDALARFVSERCHLGGGDLSRTSTSELRAAYAKWCAAEGERETSPQVFGRELRSRYGIDQAKSNGRRFYVGVTLLADPDEPDRGEEWWQK